MKDNNTLKVLELFGGIGAVRKALMNLEINFNVLDYVEFDDKPLEIYNLLYNENYTTQDIKDFDTDLDIDLLVHGSPCQSFSSAGKQEGGVKGSGTRSSLIYETIRIVEKIKPRYVIWENVKNVLSNKHKDVALDYFVTLKNLGYTTSYMVVNAKYCGIPQARERIIAVSILGDTKFKFPEYDKVANDLENYLDFRDKDDLTENFYKRYKQVKNPDATLEEFITYISDLPVLKGIGSKKMGLYNFGEMDTITTCTNLTGTLTCRNVQNYNKKYWYNNKLYKPSPKMCFKLMGFTEEDYNKVKHLPDKQLYNAAGNSIVVQVLETILKELFVNS